MVRAGLAGGLYLVYARGAAGCRDNRHPDPSPVSRQLHAPDGSHHHADGSGPPRDQRPVAICAGALFFCQFLLCFKAVYPTYNFWYIQQQNKN